MLCEAVEGGGVRGEPVWSHLLWPEGRNVAVAVPFQSQILDPITMHDPIHIRSRFDHVQKKGWGPGSDLTLGALRT